MESFDLIVIGAGTHGAGVAADAAGRGLRVILIDEQDIGESTAAVSSQLLVGGLRYLEQYQLGLVRESLAERHVLMKRSPFLVEVRPFIQVIHPQRMSLRQARLVLRAYDWLGARKLGRHERLALPQHPYGKPLKKQLEHGLLYFDCTGNDSRLAVLNARQAHSLNATICPETRILRMKRQDKQWELDLEQATSGERRAVRAGALINTAGMWAESLLQQAMVKSRCRSRRVKVSHIIVPAMYEGDQVYVLTGPNGHRICINPIGDGLHLIGAAESDFGGQADPRQPSPGEIDWLCQVVNEHFAKQISESDIVYAYSGLRTVYDDPGRPGSQVARHFMLDLDCPDCHSPLLRVYGGRVTNYRRMAESALQTLKPWLPKSTGRWTRHTPLPCGTTPADGPNMLHKQLLEKHPDLEPATVHRLIRCYGSETPELLSTATQPAPLLAKGILKAELDYLARNEWVHTGAQALRRMGLEHRSDNDLLDSLQKHFAFKA